MNFTLTELVQVRDHLLHGKPLVNTAREYMRNIAVEEAIYRSSEQKKQVVLLPETHPRV